MTQENFDNPELKDVFDDLISQDKFDILSCDEPYAPPNLSFKEICTYPFIGSYLRKDLYPEVFEEMKDAE